MKQNFFVFLILAVLLSGFPACQPQPQSNRKSIVVTYSILGSVVRAIVGDQADVIVPMPNGLDPHEWQPSAKDIEKFNKADLVVENGLGLESGMSKTLDTARKNGVKFFTASDHIVVRKVGPGEGIPAVDPDLAIGAPDPHLWTDPLAMKSIAAALTVELKADFGWDVAAGAGTVEAEMDSLNADITAIVAQIPPENRKLVTGHESMGYFAQRYGFKLIGVIIPSLSSQAAVSAANMAALKQAVLENSVKAIFTELGTSPAEAKTIGEETGVKVVQLTTHALPADGAYTTFEKNLATVIADALK